MKILIADSDRLQLEAYQNNILKMFAFLRKLEPAEHIEVQYCSTGDEVVSLMKSTSYKYDLSILDRSLSGIPGDILIQLYKDRLGKIIVCSVFNKIDNILYLQKPIDFDKLSMLIKEALNVTDEGPDPKIQDYEVIG